MKTRKLSRLAVAGAAAAVVMLAGLTNPAFAQCMEEQKLTSSNAALFGFRVSMSGDTIIVGAVADDCEGARACGAAYIYRLNGTAWVEEQRLAAPDGATLELFGASVSVSGDTAVVGVARDDCAAGLACGSAYVYRFNGTAWVEEQKLAASDGAQLDQFGRSVCVEGDTIVVGETGHGGSVYVFHFDGLRWIESQVLTAFDAAAGAQFGSTVSLSGDTLAVGAFFDDCRAGHNCGSAYIFRLTGTAWVVEQKLTAFDAGTLDLFGSVSLSGYTAVVGATGDDCSAGADCGAAYVYRFNGFNWFQQQKLTASDAMRGDHFGASVSVSGETIVVGARDGRCAAGEECGSAYIFTFDGTSWVQEQKFTSSDAAPGDSFGSSVSLSGDTIVAGAYRADCTAGSGCGAAYVFSCASAPMVAKLDIKPDSCSNPVNPRSRGVVPIVLLGSLDFDVATVDPDSLILARADGVGGSVLRLSARRGPGIVIEDILTPFGDEPCTCHEFGADGIDDLSLKFSTAEMARALELFSSQRGESIELVLQGTLFDGTTFEARDCIVIAGKQGNLRGVLHTGKK